LLRNRIHHWTCSKFANFIRGEKKPDGLTWEGWEEWRLEQQKKRPIRYWLAEEGLRKLQNFLMFPIDILTEIKYYVRNRWIDKTHFLKTGLKPGNYYDLDHRIINALFTELVDFIEIECAHMQIWGNKNKYKIKNGRCIEAGVDYLDWSCSLRYDQDYGINKDDPKFGKPTHQAIVAQKIKELYLWWKDRPNRPDPMDILEKSDDENLFTTVKLTKKQRSDYKKVEKIEEQYDKEDTKMLIDLIKIRKSLWT
jgi:hypothetical protein